MKQYPEIRFQRSNLLMRVLDTDLRPVYQELGKEGVLDRDFIEDRRATFEKLWRAEEHKILKGLCDIFDLEFRQNTIDVYVAPLRGSFSSPMVIATKAKEEELVRLLTHELLHRLLSDNTSSHYESWRDRWPELFGKEYSEVTVNHIAVHAGLQALWTEVIKKPEYLEQEKAYTLEPYIQSWEYVDTHGYQEIIQKVKQSFHGS